MTRFSLATVTGILLLLCCLPAQAESGLVAYHAETVAPARVEGEVIAAKISWSCAGTTCKAMAPETLNQDEMCRDLARQVGPLRVYEFGATSLTAGQLQSCNGDGASIKPQTSFQATPSTGSVKPIAIPPIAELKPHAPAPALAPVRSIKPENLARFSPMSSALAAAARSSVPNLDEYLAASRRYVELPAAQRTSAYVQAVNAQFAEPIRGAISRSVGGPDIGELMQSVQLNSSSCEPCAGDPGPPESQIASCCSSRQFAPPFEGLTHEGDNGSTEVVPDVAVTQLSASVRGFGAAAPHRLEGSTLRISVPDSSRHERVTVSLSTQWVIGLSGLGYAHVWLGLDMQVTKAGSGVACRAPHLEQDNQWTWAGGYLTMSDRRPGPTITRTCEFERTPGDSTDYVVTVSAIANGTFVGTSGGYGDYFVVLGPVDVTSCP